MKYISSSSSSFSVLPLIDNEQQFFILREKLFAQSSIKQASVIKSVAAVNLIGNVQNNRQTTATTTTAAAAQTMHVTVKIKDNDDKFKNSIFIHCIHEARLTDLPRHIHEIHESFFKTNDHGAIRLVVGHLNNPNIDFQLTRKRPHSSLLKDPSKKSNDIAHSLLNHIYFLLLSFLLELKPNERPPPPPTTTTTTT